MLREGEQLSRIRSLVQANFFCSFATNTLVKNIPWQLAVILIIATSSAHGQALTGQPRRPVANDFSSYRPITSRQRLNWFIVSTVGPVSLTAGLFSAGLSTARNNPAEYGPHWDGFGKRYGMRLTGVSTGNAMEAGLGSLWGEDPRYFRAIGEPFKGRVKNILVMTFAARRPDGNLAPAYARFVGNVGNNFLSNTWRAESDSSVGDACFRVAVGVLGKMGGNAFSEFWPDARKYIFHKK